MGEIGIVVFLRNVGEDKITGAGVETFRIRKELADSVIGEMASAGEDALLDDPRVGTDLEHIEVVIGFEDHAVGFAEMDLNHFREVAQIGADGDLCAITAKSETNGVSGIVGNGESVNVNIAYGKVLAGLDGLDALETFLKGFGKDAVERVHGGFGHIERRRLPETEDLRKAGAMIGMFVSDEDGVEVIDFAADGGEAGKRFPFAQTGVNEDAGAFCFQQSEIARATGRQNGNAQADDKSPGMAELRKLFK